MTRDAARQAQIGRDIEAARAAGVRWKQLERRYGLGRARLNQLWKEARGCSGAGAGKVSIDTIGIARPATTTAKP